MSKGYSIFLIFLGAILLSCSSSQKISSEKFNPEEYYNPYNPDVNSQATDKNASKHIKGRPNIRVTAIHFPKVKGGIQALNKSAKYPAEAKREKIQGTVISQIYLDEKGRVRHITILQSPDVSLSNAAKEAIKRSDFEPAKRNDKPIKSILRVPIRFILQ